MSTINNAAARIRIREAFWRKNVEGQFKVQDLPHGEYVRKPGKERVWIRGDYDRATKTFSLIAFDDINREIFVKRGTMLEAGFTF